MRKANIFILATGGTIAGIDDSKIKTTSYTSGVLSVETLVDTAEIMNVANIKTEQIANIDSADMSDDIWLTLAKKINIVLNDSIDGVVVTHGTDTMEETAFFLHLTIASNKPVVLVGAMRPSSAMSADGPKNLYNAVALATSLKASGKGVMIAMNDKIQSARWASKMHTSNTDSFHSPNQGDMGYMLDGDIFLHSHTSRPHTTASIFRVDKLKTLPKVDILYSYSNDGSAVAAEALFNAGAKGIVVAGSGAGNIHKNHRDKLKELTQKGLIVVQSSRTGAGIVKVNEKDNELGFIGAGDLNPQKARVLLMLALTKTQDPLEIAKIFRTY